MLKDYFTKAGIEKLLSRVRIGGDTIASHLRQNRENNKAGYYQLFKRAVRAKLSLDQFATGLQKKVKTRKRHTLTTLRNIMSSIRGEARAILATGQGTWHNNGVLDGKTTEICAGYIGASWELPYSQIPDKPPRVSITPHPCRSFLTFVKEGEQAPNQAPFMEQFGADEELQKELLGPTRFEAYKSGSLMIDSFVDYEKSVLTTLEDLGL